MARQVKCKICGEKIASDTAYCIEKTMKRQAKKQEVTTVLKKNMIKTNIRKVFGKKFYYYMIIF